MNRGVGFLSETRVLKNKPKGIRTPEGFVMELDLSTGNNYIEKNIATIPRSLSDILGVPSLFYMESTQSQNSCLTIKPITSTVTTDCTIMDNKLRISLKPSSTDGYFQIYCPSTGKCIWNKNNKNVNTDSYSISDIPAMYYLWRFIFIRKYDATRDVYKVHSRGSKLSPSKENEDNQWLGLFGNGRNGGVEMVGMNEPGSEIYIRAA